MTWTTKHVEWETVATVTLEGAKHLVAVDGDRVQAIRLSGVWHDADILAPDFRAALDEAYALAPAN